MVLQAALSVVSGGPAVFALLAIDVHQRTFLRQVLRGISSGFDRLYLAATQEDSLLLGFRCAHGCARRLDRIPARALRPVTRKWGLDSPALYALASGLQGVSLSPME